MPRGKIIENNGGLEVGGNAWKAMRLPFTISANTFLSFEVRIDVNGEILGIGLDSDVSESSAQIFQLAGTQSYGNGDFRSIVADGQWYAVEIPIGTYDTGNMNYLAFIGDDELASSQLSSYRNPRIEDIGTSSNAGSAQSA